MLKALLVSFLFCFFVFQSACLADIRPDSKQVFTADDEVRGRALLEELKVAHGYKASDRDAFFEYLFEDEWPNAMMSPWPSDAEKMLMSAPLGRDDSVLVFQDGSKKGVRHGIKEGRTFREPGPQRRRDPNQFWLPTVQYFLEVPFRLADAEIVYAAGEATLGDIVCERVYLTWLSVEPNQKSDQYVAYIDKKTKRLVRLEYTVREMMYSLVSGMDFRNPVQHEGIWFAKDMVVSNAYGTPESEALHIMRLHSAKRLSN